MAYTIAVTGDLQGTEREQGFKESDLISKFREFARTLEGVTAATITLEQRGEVDILDQTSPGGVYAGHHQERIDAANE